MKLPGLFALLVITELASAVELKAEFDPSASVQQKAGISDEFVE
jgi:hypothetical protein